MAGIHVCVSPHNISRRGPVTTESERLRNQARDLREQSETQIKRAKEAVAQARESTKTAKDMLANRKHLAPRV